ncbi:MAG: hypothetical protein ACRDL7_03760, partial [Gaiellaceae bacterium]
IIDDDIIVLYRKIQDWSDRATTDARNSAAQPPDFYQEVAKLFNDPSFEVETEVSKFHSDFAEKMTLAHNPQNAPNSTAQKIRDKLQQDRAALAIIVNNWERSGNSDGQPRDSEDVNYGRDRELTDNDNRAQYLNGKGTHLLYMWHLFAKYDILVHSLKRLSSDITVDGRNMPTTVTKSGRKGNGNKDTLVPSADALALKEALEAVAESVDKSTAAVAKTAAENTAAVAKTAAENLVDKMRTNFFSALKEHRAAPDDQKPLHAMMCAQQRNRLIQKERELGYKPSFSANDEPWLM